MHNIDHTNQFLVQKKLYLACNVKLGIQEDFYLGTLGSFYYFTHLQNIFKALEA